MRGGRGGARQHRYDDTRKTALKAALARSRDKQPAAACALSTVQLRCHRRTKPDSSSSIRPSHPVRPSVRPSIHPEVFAPSHFHLDGIFSFLSAKTHATEEKAQIEDAEGETLSSEQRKKTDSFVVSSFFQRIEMNERKETIITECSE